MKLADAHNAADLPVEQIDRPDAVGGALIGEQDIAHAALGPISRQVQRAAGAVEEKGHLRTGAVHPVIAAVPLGNGRKVDLFQHVGVGIEQVTEFAVHQLVGAKPLLLSAVSDHDKVSGLVRQKGQFARKLVILKRDALANGGVPVDMGRAAVWFAGEGGGVDRAQHGRAPVVAEGGS